MNWMSKQPQWKQAFHLLLVTLLFWAFLPIFFLCKALDILIAKRRRQTMDFPGAEHIMEQLEKKNAVRKRVGLVTTSGGRAPRSKDKRLIKGICHISFSQAICKF
jgi:hypothetical protein